MKKFKSSKLYTAEYVYKVHGIREYCKLHNIDYYRVIGNDTVQTTPIDMVALINSRIDFPDEVVKNSMFSTSMTLEDCWYLSIINDSPCQIVVPTINKMSYIDYNIYLDANWTDKSKDRCDIEISNGIYRLYDDKKVADIIVVKDIILRVGEEGKIWMVSPNRDINCRTNKIILCNDIQSKIRNVVHIDPVIKHIISHVVDNEKRIEGESDKDYMSRIKMSKEEGLSYTFSADLTSDIVIKAGNCIASLIVSDELPSCTI